MNWKAAGKELDRGISRFVRDIRVHAMIGMYMMCDMLPHLPDPIAKKIMDKFLSIFGLGD